MSVNDITQGLRSITLSPERRFRSQHRTSPHPSVNEITKSLKSISLSPKLSVSKTRSTSPRPHPQPRTRPDPHPHTRPHTRPKTISTRRPRLTKADLEEIAAAMGVVIYIP